MEQLKSYYMKKLLVKNQPWVAAYAPNYPVPPHAVCEFQWLIPMNRYRMQEGFADISEGDQHQVMSKVYDTICQEGSVRLDGSMAVNDYECMSVFSYCQFFETNDCCGDCEGPH